MAHPGQNEALYLYGYNFVLNPAKTVQSVRLPKQWKCYCHRHQPRAELATDFRREFLLPD